MVYNINKEPCHVSYCTHKFASPIAINFNYMNNALLANHSNCPYNYFAVKDNKLLRFPFIHCSIMHR